MADIVEMTRRGSATEAKSTEAKSTGAKSAGVTSTVANEQRQRRERQLVGLLQAVERRILRDHREIAALRAKQAADARDLEQLRTLLQVMLTLAEQGPQLLGIPGGGGLFGAQGGDLPTVTRDPPFHRLQQVQELPVAPLALRVRAFRLRPLRLRPLRLRVSRGAAALHFDDVGHGCGRRFALGRACGRASGET